MTAYRSLRTPEDRFSSLVGFDYQPSYVDSLNGFESLRLAYVDTGPATTTTTFLCLHGEPTWSYLYRKMAPVFAAHGHRVVMPDLFGFGRSDKPIDDAVYTFEFHRNAVLRLIELMDLSNVVLVVQDWGGLIGLTLPMAEPDRFRGLLVMNTTLACGEGPPSAGFTAWRDYMRKQPDLDVGALMARAVDGLSPAEASAYDAPFPDMSYKAGVRRFPAIVATESDMEGADIARASRSWLQRNWRGQTFMAVGKRDPVLGPTVMRSLRDELFPNAELLEVPQAGHFVQEHGREIAEVVCDTMDLR